jgi:hypothetical protein
MSDEPRSPQEPAPGGEAGQSSAPPPYGEAPQGTSAQDNAQQQAQSGYGQQAQQPYGQQAYGQYQQPAYGQYQQQYQYPYGQFPQYPYGQQYGYQQPGGYLTYPIEPSNDAALASLITSLVSIGLLILSSGILSPFTLIGGIVGIVLGRKGTKNVDEGRTRKQRDMAQGGFVAGIIGVVLSVLAIVAWILIIVFAISEADVGSGQLD